MFLSSNSVKLLEKMKKKKRKKIKNKGLFVSAFDVPESSLNTVAEILTPMTARGRVFKGSRTQTPLGVEFQFATPSFLLFLFAQSVLSSPFSSHISAITSKLRIKDTKSIQTSELTICIQASLFIPLPGFCSSELLLLIAKPPIFPSKRT